MKAVLLCKIVLTSAPDLALGLQVQFDYQFVTLCQRQRSYPDEHVKKLWLFSEVM